MIRTRISNDKGNEGHGNEKRWKKIKGQMGRYIRKYRPTERENKQRERENNVGDENNV